jgi:hypothetical protein
VCRFIFNSPKGEGKISVGGHGYICDSLGGDCKLLAGIALRMSKLIKQKESERIETRGEAAPQAPFEWPRLQPAGKGANGEAEEGGQGEKAADLEPLVWLTTKVLTRALVGAKAVFLVDYGEITGW